MLGASQDLGHLDIAGIDPLWTTRPRARGRATRILVQALAVIGVAALAGLGVEILVRL